VVNAFNCGYRYVLLNLPTGIGKTLINMAVANSFSHSFYLVHSRALQKQIMKDKKLKGTCAEIKGRRNYPCLRLISEEDFKKISDDDVRAVYSCQNCYYDQLDRTLSKIKELKKEIKKLKEQQEKFKKSGEMLKVWKIEKEIEKKRKLILKYRETLKQKADERQTCRASCPYRQAKLKAIRSQTALMNFAYFVVEGFNNSEFGDREFMVIDEAHTLLSAVIKFQETTLYLPDKYQTEDIDTLLEYCTTYSIDLKNDVKEIEGKILEEYGSFSALLDKAVYDDEANNLREEYGEKSRKLSRILRFTENRDSYWVLKEKEKIEEDKVIAYTVSPIYCDTFLKKNVFSRARFFLLSSATIINPSNFARELGIDSEGYTIVEFPSIFPKENRPIFVYFAGNMSKNKKEGENSPYEINLPNAIQRIRKILNEEKGRGIIHSISYNSAWDVYKGLNTDKRIVLHRKGENTEHVIKRWQKKKDGVLISPAITEGINLPYDMCRFQILLKVPYLDLGDVIVKTRVKQKHEQEWYDTQTISRIIQAYGRAIRSEDDKASFYILDSSFYKLYYKCRTYFPAWFREAVKFI